MNIYRISQTENDGWDTYDSAVVCAPNQDAARETHPAYGYHDAEAWKVSSGSWASSPDKVSVEYIGEAQAARKQSVICASFNAG